MQGKPSSLASSLIVLIGLPGSGKSTLARSMVEAWRNRSLLCNHPDAVLISTDAIRAQLFGDEAIQGSWLPIWLEVRRQFQAAAGQTSQGKVGFAIYDATNAVRKHRRAAIALARKTGFTHIIGIWVNTPLAVCLERNQQRKSRPSMPLGGASRVVPEAVILRMNRRLSGAPPSLEDGLDRLIELY
ncbi:ATP-binding protein [Myxacorys almedinensis]|uniref:ATP-binding protein n=1 Tax=Myxacorys almedinensis TaxID=2651157 RepID=UPI003082EF4B